MKPTYVRASDFDFPTGWTPSGARFCPAIEANGITLYHSKIWCPSQLAAKQMAADFVDQAATLGVGLRIAFALNPDWKRFVE